MKNRILEQTKIQVSEHTWLESYVSKYEHVLAELERFCLPARKKALKGYKSRYEQFFRLVELGCEPATPPTGWYAGVLKECWRLSDVRQAIVAASLRIGNLPSTEENYWLYASSVFISYVPPEVYQKYKQATRIVDRARLVVVSPAPNHFVVPLALSDPMLFVYVGIDDITWLRVCSWDIAGDLTLKGIPAAFLEAQERNSGMQ